MPVAFLAIAPVAFAATPECVSCHARQVRGYLETGMGRSISRNFAQPGATIAHEFSGTKFTIAASRAGMRQRVERAGLVTEREVDYVIGSGNSAFGYLLLVGDRIFQSPLSFYSRKAVWAVAPGFESNPHPEFERPVTAECLWCHAGRPRPIARTVNRFESPPFAAEAISCDRCHGPVEGHLQSPSSSTILNPARLPAVARDSVCEQCHLSGEVRVLNPGKTFGDFEAGMPLEQVFSVYLQEVPEGPAGRFKVVSHVEQLAASRCSRESGGKLWCGTCHNPHEKPANPAAYYRERCLSCHGATLAKAHLARKGTCASCHMPRRTAFDSGHAAFTDHRIAKTPAEGMDPTPAERLRAWREPTPELAQRNLGLAYAQVGVKQQSAAMSDTALKLLMQAMKAFPRDAEIPARLGELLLLKRRSELALELFQYAASLDPEFPPRHAAVADAAVAAGKPVDAVQSFERAIALDAMYEPAYRGLAKLHADDGRVEEARAVWRRYLEQAPGSIFARQAMGRLGK